MSFKITNLICSIALMLPFAGSGQMVAPDPPSAIVAAAESAFPEYDTGATFDEILKDQGPFPDTIVIPRTFDSTPNGSLFNAPKYPSPHIMSIVARSDFAAIGIPTKRWTFPLSGNSFTVSIYLVHITNAPIPGKDSVGSGQDIYVARAGGPIVYNSHAFRGIDPNFQLFHLNEAYLFLGSKIAPMTYKVDSDRVLKIEGSILSETSIKRPYAGHFEGKAASVILNEISDAWAAQGRAANQERP